VSCFFKNRQKIYIPFVPFLHKEWNHIYRSSYVSILIKLCLVAATILFKLFGAWNGTLHNKIINTSSTSSTPRLLATWLTLLFIFKAFDQFSKFIFQAHLLFNFTAGYKFKSQFAQINISIDIFIQFFVFVTIKCFGRLSIHLKNVFLLIDKFLYFLHVLRLLSLQNKTM